jgi:Domain of unknown function (DUF4173)
VTTAAEQIITETKEPCGASKLAYALTAAIALTAFADYLFFGHAVGWSATLFSIAFLLTAAIHEPGRLRSPRGKLLFALLMGLALSFAESPGALASLLMILTLPAFLLEREETSGRRARRLLPISLFLPLALVLAVFEDAGEIREIGKYWRVKQGIATSLNLLIPLIFVSVFAALFSFANPIFAQFLDALKFDWRLDIPRIAFWVGVFAALWGLLRLHRTPLLKEHANAGRAPLGGEPGRFKPLDTIFSPAVVLRSLILFNALFLLENGLDIAFLWGGRTLPEGVTYAQYAHRGAYPLIVTALLAAAFVLIG